MKRPSFLVISLVWLLLPCNQAIAALETYTIDPTNSYLLWHVNHFGFSNPSGKWMIHGTLELDKSQPQNSKVTAIIRVTDIITGVPELDKKLRTKLFFYTDKFPKAIFISDRVSLTGKKTARVHGMLTLHGVTKPIVLNVTFNKAGRNPISNNMSVGFSASTQLKRTEFDINTLLPGVSDEVKITIELEAYQ